jgi:hypothetical protein
MVDGITEKERSHGKTGNKRASESRGHGSFKKKNPFLSGARLGSHEYAINLYSGFSHHLPTGPISLKLHHLNSSPLQPLGEMLTPHPNHSTSEISRLMPPTAFQQDKVPFEYLRGKSLDSPFGTMCCLGSWGAFSSQYTIESITWNHSRYF